MPLRLRAPLPTLVLQQSRRLRKDNTDVENELWYHLRDRRMQGVKFRRQHPIPPYTVDFYCDAAKLVVELDGSQHSAEGDRSRTEFLMRRGLTVMRFDNVDVIQHRGAVLDAIWQAVAPFAPHPNPRSAPQPAPAARAFGRTRASGASTMRPHPNGRGARAR